MKARTREAWSDAAEGVTPTGWQRLNERIIERFMTRPSIGANPARLLILAVIGAIGVVDYASGIRISLSVCYLVPIALAVSWFGWKDGVGAVVISLVARVLGDYLSIDEASLPLWSWWNSLAALTIMLIVVWILDALLALRRQLEARVAERTSRLVEAAQVRERLEHELMALGERERNAFGQELHDDVCQHLVGTALAAKVHTRNLAGQGNALADEAQALVGWIEEGAQKTRRLARGLLLAQVDPDDLRDHLMMLVEDANQADLVCRLQQSGDVKLPDGTVAAQLFRIVQEAIRNAQKHAAAAQVAITMVGDVDAIVVSIADDGRGVAATSPSRDGMGLRIMAHRAESIGGRLSIEHPTRGGTRVVVRIPRDVSRGASANLG